MEPFWVLLGLAIFMLVGSLVAGSVPLMVDLSEDKLKAVSLFGAGLLVGTALTVIIPEGIRSLAAEKHEDMYMSIGVALVFGFIFMLIIDHISTKKIASQKNFTTTLGLVVHAAADGIALGAAATTSHTDVELIVFLAIMLHKAPAAFGLVTFLLHERVQSTKIRNHLMIFSASAPISTVITFFCIGQYRTEADSTFSLTGIAMLFSAGTFLYVATVHVLPETTQSPQHGAQYSQLPGPEAGKSLGPSSRELLYLVCGCMAPLLLNLLHDHH